MKDGEIENILKKSQVFKEPTYPITDMRIFYSISELGKEINKAKMPPISRTKIFQVVDFEPGTGRAALQLASYLRALEQGKLNCKNISKEDLFVLLRTYIEDGME